MVSQVLQILLCFCYFLPLCSQTLSQTKSPGYIVAGSDGGLSNRLRALVAYMHIAKARYDEAELGAKRWHWTLIFVIFFFLVVLHLPCCLASSLLSCIFLVVLHLPCCPVSSLLSCIFLVVLHLPYCLISSYVTLYTFPYIHSVRMGCQCSLSRPFLGNF